MKKRLLFLILLVGFVPVLVGCVPLIVVVGAAGVVGGYAVSPDTVEGQVSRSLEEVYDAAREITGIMGQVAQEMPAGNQIVAIVNGARVTVTLTAVNVSTTKLSVKARKSFMPKIDISQDVYAKILNSMDQ